MTLVWTLSATCLLVASSVATLLTTLHLRFRWDVHTSSVRWLFWFFFLSVFVWSLMRAMFFVWMSSRPRIELVDDEEAPEWSYSQLDRLGIHGIMYMEEAKKAWLTTLVCVGDLGLLGIALTLFPLTYELWRLARKSMDRGVKKEKQQIKIYWRFLTVGLVVYALVQCALCLAFGGYNVHTHRCLLAVYGLQFISLAFMVGQLVMLKINGRKYETIHGTFVASPVYGRLKGIMFVYAFFAFQFQVSMIVIVTHHVIPDGALLDFVGVSLLIYNASGLALSITTSCSQACVLSACSPCLPEDFEAQFLHHRFAAPKDEDLEPPSTDPVFVFTDIQSSTALWNLNGEMMAKATEIHDNIMRSALLKHRGYEITTVGDAFQTAFHTIGDALEFCLDVQLQLLVADWPKLMQSAIPATERLRAGRRVVFNGLRVRMGIHDVSEADGPLVRNVHAVTGKATYTGVSEVIAESISDLGSGGQILVTDRVATWLKLHRNDVSIDVFMDYVGTHSMPQVQTTLEIYQLQPAMLAARVEFFPRLTLRSIEEPVDPHDTRIFPLLASVNTDQSLDPIVEEPERSENETQEVDPQYKMLHTPRRSATRLNWLQPFHELPIAA